MDCSSCTVINKPIELEKIQEANRYILSHLDESLTIPQIAQQVGTNQCYLKKGFKEYYQQTIYEFIQENRMVKANSILQEGKVPLSLTATLVGYSSLSSFSNAYKNYFGVTPKEHLKEFQKAKNYT
jgi:AraC-like DNA-binding protein